MKTSLGIEESNEITKVVEEAYKMTKQTEENLKCISDHHQCQQSAATTTEGQNGKVREEIRILSKTSLPKIDEVIKTFIRHDCDRCGKLVGFSDAKFVRKYEKHWHENCLVCSLCQVELWSEKHFLRKPDGALFCQPCSGNDRLSNSQCAKCEKDILDGGLEYKNQALHRGCFTCFKCRKRLVDKFVSKDEGPFCLDCFQRQSESVHCLKKTSGTCDGLSLLHDKDSVAWANKTATLYQTEEEKQFRNKYLLKPLSKHCAKCDEEIVGNCMEYYGEKYHQKCFNCSHCKQTLSGQYNVKKGMLFCQDCGKESNHLNKEMKKKETLYSHDSMKEKRIGGFRCIQRIFHKLENQPKPRITEKGGYHRKRSVHIQKTVRYHTLQIRREQDQRIHSPYVQVSF